MCRDELPTAQMISEALRITYPLTHNIMAKLRKKGLIASAQGRNGGYRVAKSAHNINLYDVVLAMEGELKISYSLEADQEHTHRNQPCALQDYYKEVGETLIQKLESKSIADFDMIQQ